MKLFRGYVRSNRNKSVLCERKINESYHFHVDIPFGECSLEKHYNPSPTYIGSLIVKEGSTDMITVHDKMINVNCRLHQAAEMQKENRLLNVRFYVQQDNFSSPLSSDAIPQTSQSLLITTTSLPPSFPKYRLEVVDRDGRLVDVVDVNDMGYLQITLEQEQHANPAGYFSISELVAENTSGKGRIELIDAAGCVSNPAILKSLQKTKGNQLRVGILFSGFKDQAKVSYQALVKPCVYSCMPECNKQYFIGSQSTENSSFAPYHTRSVRAIGGVDALRHLDLTDDLYQVHSKDTTIKWLDQQKFEDKQPLPKTSHQLTNKYGEKQNNEVIKEHLSSDFWGCLANRNCVFTLLLMSIQMILLMLGASLAYFYIKQYLHQRQQTKLYSSAMPVKYNFSGTSNNLMDTISEVKKIPLDTK